MFPKYKALIFQGTTSDASDFDTENTLNLKHNEIFAYINYYAVEPLVNFPPGTRPKSALSKSSDKEWPQGIGD